MIERQQDVGAAAGANDERLRSLQQVIRQRRGGVVEIAERFQPAVKGGDRAETPAIGEDTKLWRRPPSAAAAGSALCGLSGKSACQHEKTRPSEPGVYNHPGPGTAPPLDDVRQDQRDRHKGY